MATNGSALGNKKSKTNIVKIVTGSYGHDEHQHEDYWDPLPIGEYQAEKVIKRKMKKVERNGLVPRQSSVSSSVDVLDREVNFHELKQ